MLVWKSLTADNILYDVQLWVHNSHESLWTIMCGTFVAHDLSNY